MVASYPSSDGGRGVLETAARHLASVDRAESLTERVTLLAAAEAELVSARATLRDLDSKLSAYKAETSATADRD